MTSPGGNKRCGARIFGHPVHPILTDFPIALWSVSVLWDVISLLWGGSGWATFAFWSIVAGLVMALPTLATGLTDFIALPKGHPATRTAVLHMTAMLAAAIAFGASLFLREGVALSSWPALAASLIGLALLFTGGWLGGKLVFHHGLGRE